MVNFHFPMVEIPFPDISSPKPQSVDSQSGPLARLQVLQNSGSQMFLLRIRKKTCQCKIATVTDEIQEEKIKER